jgi:hypothetical protein
MARLPTLSLEVPSEFRKRNRFDFPHARCLGTTARMRVQRGGESTPAPPCRASAALESASPAPPTTPPCARSRPARGPHPRRAASATPRPAPAAGRSAAAPSAPSSALPAFGSRRPETDSKSSYLCRGWGANLRRVYELSSWWLRPAGHRGIRPSAQQRPRPYPRPPRQPSLITMRSTRRRRYSRTTPVSGSLRVA